MNTFRPLALFVALALAAQLALAAGSNVAAQTTSSPATARPYAIDLALGSADGARTFGPGAGSLGLTSITATNTSGSPAYAVIYSAYVAGPTCDSPIVTAVNFRLPMFVPPQATVQLTFPTALVFPPVNGLSCAGVQVTQGSGAEFLFNGFVR